MRPTQEEWCNFFFSRPLNLNLHQSYERESKGDAKYKQNAAVDCCLTSKNRIEDSLKEAEIQPPSVQLTPWGAAICAVVFFFLLKL